MKSNIYGISEAKTYLTRSNRWIEKCAQYNRAALKHIANLSNNEHLFLEDEEIILTKCANVRVLHDVQEVERHCNVQENTELIKQGSDTWMKLRKKCVVTGSTCFNALGLRSKKAMDEHYNEYVYDKGP